VKYTDEAIKAAVELSAKYIGDRKLPDKAIDLIDEVGAAQMLVPANKRKKTITDKPISRPSSRSSRAFRLQIHDQRRQGSAADSRSRPENHGLRSGSGDFGSDDSIKMARAGLRDSEKPIGSYLILGPDGRR
jgi:ATP-dependent Clp protease ATP-binding subunit ClpA